MNGIFGRRRGETDFTFGKVFDFLIKRLKEIGYQDADELVKELKKVSNELQVRAPHTYHLESGLIVNPDYKMFGLKEK